MSEHPLNEMNRRVIAEAERTYAATGDMALAVKAATRQALDEVAKRHADRGMIFDSVGARHHLENRDALNVLYCAGRLVPVNATQGNHIEVAS